jgi:hypothetical protein
LLVMVYADKIQVRTSSIDFFPTGNLSQFTRHGGAFRYHATYFLLIFLRA